MKTQIISLFAIGLAGVALAAPLTFDFKDPKGVNNVQFNLDAPLEAISGSANGITGQLVFDPAQPGSASGRIVLDASTLTVGNPLMKEHLHSAMWLDVAKNPEITFEAVSLKNVRTT